MTAYEDRVRDKARFRVSVSSIPETAWDLKSLGASAIVVHEPLFS